jgi:hypothetical protein
MFCLLLLVGCAGPSAAQEASVSQSHLDREENLLTDALHHIDTARREIPTSAGLQSAPGEISAGYNSLSAAHDLLPTIRKDVTDLADTATSLQNQIDSHRNDLLGPRARRIRNRVIVISLLLGFGAALLQLGPLIGGPFGGGLIVAGHLLTVFLVPLWQAALAVLKKTISAAVAGITKIVGYLDTLAGSGAAALTKTSTNQEGSGTPHAAAASDSRRATQNPHRRSRHQRPPPGNAPGRHPDSVGS